jgi:hypothetical protein
MRPIFVPHPHDLATMHIRSQRCTSDQAASSRRLEANRSSFRFRRNRSVPRHGAKNIFPVIERWIVPAATTSHMRTQIAVKTYKGKQRTIRAALVL